MPILQKIYNIANAQVLSDTIQTELKGHFSTQNSLYGYFSTEEEKSKAQQEFVDYYKLFSQLQKDSEDGLDTLLPDELYQRAYKAMVLFGGQAMRKGINVLDKLIEDQNNGTENPLNHSMDTFFSDLIIPPKAKDMDLSYWRALINGPQTKKALKLFAISSAIADKFGSVSQGYTVALTRTYPIPRNTKAGILYLYASREPGLLGYAFKKNSSDEFVRGTIKKSDLSFSDDLVAIFEDASWKNGERWPDWLSNTQLDTLFSLISQASSVPISREQTLLDMEDYRGKLLYKRFTEAPELGLFCTRYNIAEHVFNRCLALLNKPKKSDTMPDIYIDGAELGHPGYHLLKLPANDYHAFFLGYLVNCCQSMGRAAEQVVLDGWSMKDRGFYVLVKEHKPVKGVTPSRSDLLNLKNATILGQCYAWRSNYNNVVIDSWDNLMSEHDDIAEKMLRKYAQQAVDDPKHKVFRVTVGVSGGKTPLALRKKLAEAPETTSRGLHHKDSKIQAEINSRDIKKWEQELAKFLEQFPDLSAQKKQELIGLKQRSVYYQAMLRTFLSEPVLVDYVSKHTAPMDSLMVLYVLLRKQPDSFVPLMKKMLELIPEQHLDTHRMRINVLFLSRLIIDGSLQSSPTLLADVASLLQCVNALNSEDLEQLFVKLQDTKNTTFLMACAINQPLLDVARNGVSVKTRQALIMEKRSGKNILYDVVNKPELLRSLLHELPEKNRFNAVHKRGRNDKPLLHFAIGNPESVRIILNTYPKERRLAAVQQVFGGERQTSMHLAMQHPESFRVMLDCLADSNECLAAVSKPNKAGKTAVDQAAQNPQILMAILKYIPQHALKIQSLSLAEKIQLIQHPEVEDDLVQHLVTDVESPELLNSLSGVVKQGHLSETVAKTIIENPHVCSTSLINLINRNHQVAALCKLLSLNEAFDSSTISLKSMNKLMQQEEFQHLEEEELIKILRLFDDKDLHQKLLAHPQARTAFQLELCQKTDAPTTVNCLMQRLPSDNQEGYITLLKKGWIASAFHVDVLKSFLDKVVDSIKIKPGNTITSNRFILWSTESKAHKDNAIVKGLCDLNLAIVKEDKTQTKVHFDALCQTACQKRNQFSAMLTGKYSTDTESAKYLISEFSKSDKLLTALGIDVKAAYEQKVEQIRSMMLDVCNERPLEPRPASIA